MFFVCVSCFQDYRPDFFRNTESITNRADIDQKFYEIGKLPEDYADVKDFSNLGQGSEPDKNQVICWKSAEELEQIKFFPKKLVPYLKDISKLQGR